jgi:hypothetical protein
MQIPINLITVISELSGLLTRTLAANDEKPPLSFGFAEARTLAESEYGIEARSIANDLLREALDRGIPQIATTTDISELSGGAASDFVFRARTQLSFVIKVQLDPKLREEALWLASRHPDVPDSTPWGTLFPRVLSHHLSSPPYAYAMEDFRREDGYRDLASWIFDDQLLQPARDAQARALLEAVLKRLSSVYETSRSANSSPNLEGEAYLKRIEGRMQHAERLFRGFSAATVVIDGTTFRSWRVYLDQVRSNRDKAEAFFPNFETAVHGDAHPGNIIIRIKSTGTGNTEPEIRLIDPKGWTNGDYVFDLAKLAHYLEVTGPIERLRLDADFEFRSEEDRFVLENAPKSPDWTQSLERFVFERVSTLSRKIGDTGAEQRYELAMASALLGTVPLRWEKGQRSLAVLMYASGLRWLDQFCRSLSQFRPPKRPSKGR